MAFNAENMPWGCRGGTFSRIRAISRRRAAMPITARDARSRASRAASKSEDGTSSVLGRIAPGVDPVRRTHPGWFTPVNAVRIEPMMICVREEEAYFVGRNVRRAGFHAGHSAGRATGRRRSTRHPRCRGRSRPRTRTVVQPAGRRRPQERLPDSADRR